MIDNWTCYVCLEDFDIEIEPAFNCQQCIDGKQCNSCFNNPRNDSKYCGICKHPIPNINQVQNRNQNRNNEEQGYTTYIRCLLSSFFLFIFDCVILIIMIELKHTKCTPLQNILFPLVFICKSMLFFFTSYIYIWCFSRVKLIHLFRFYEHLGFYVCCIYYFYHHDNVCKLFVDKFILYYLVFLGCVLPFNSLISLIYWAYDTY